MNKTEVIHKEILQKVLNVVSKWPDDWPSRDEVYLKIKRWGNFVTAETVDYAVRHFVLSGPSYKKLDARMRKRLLRAARMSSSTKAVLLSIKEGSKTPTMIIIRANKLLRKIDPEADKIHQYSYNRHLSILAKLAEGDKEVGEILKKLKS